MTFSSSKQRTTWMMASHSRMFARNLLPRPSPSLAPLTRPAMSTNSSTAGTTLALLLISPSLSSLRSGTGTTPVLGSMVQKGKLAASAFCAFVSALNSVDLPTLGMPTMPVLSFMTTVCLLAGLANLPPARKPAAARIPSSMVTAATQRILGLPQEGILNFGDRSAACCHADALVASRRCSALTARPLHTRAGERDESRWRHDA
mmetsp:Transcript_2979/g.12058  ORF Transcript_2979/g.12058 Transcript_2979/m.12058 type:complete len:204 (+) Transcript_2979:1404-2015(+)